MESLKVLIKWLNLSLSIKFKLLGQVVFNIVSK
jgi:hypothetical protein